MQLSRSSTDAIGLAGMLPGRHKVRIELVNTNHEVFPGQSKTATFTVARERLTLTLADRYKGIEDTFV